MAQAEEVKVPIFSNYEPLPGAHDELFAARAEPWPTIAPIIAGLEGLGAARMERRQRLADNTFLKGGVTFSVYSDNRGGERIFPFDLIPRVVTAEDWEQVERGLLQRVNALNHFLADVYGDARILKEKVVPAELVHGGTGYLKEVHGIRPRGDVYVQIAGIDLVRDGQGRFLVLEDNLRCPSGVSYVLSNRNVLKKVLPKMFRTATVRNVDEYPTRLRHRLSELAPPRDGSPRVVVLTPGAFNSAYFEHGFLARRMGVDLVQASDLFVHDDRVYVKTTRGAEPVDVIYRRIDDEFIDPEVFRPDSLLGVPGLVRAYAKGNVTLANAIGNGVADDKAVYPYVPDMIRFYLKEEPILGQVETFFCGEASHRSHVLDNLSKMVVKAVDASGGYGMLIGPRSTAEQIAEFRDRINNKPRGYIAQPVVELSTCPTWLDGKARPRRVDLRPFILTGKSSWVLPGGLTRVALVEGSYVVNSSQGGGSKDTWVLGNGHGDPTSSKHRIESAPRASSPSSPGGEQ
ncbi:MAG: circularly permuted type 2 ATP-grasp protein [Myxococcales bacterium]|nr:circularly permuted type 2 ATP-grasp protein [Myxococcales bacterium]